MLQIKRNPVERFAIPFTSQKIRDYTAQKIENLRGRPDDYVKVAKKKRDHYEQMGGKDFNKSWFASPWSGHTSVFKQVTGTLGNWLTTGTWICQDLKINSHLVGRLRSLRHINGILHWNRKQTNAQFIITLKSFAFLVKFPKTRWTWNFFK